MFPTPKKICMVFVVDTNNTTISMQFTEINSKSFGTNNLTFFNAICSQSFFYTSKKNVIDTQGIHSTLPLKEEYPHPHSLVKQWGINNKDRWRGDEWLPLVTAFCNFELNHNLC